MIAARADSTGTCGRFGFETQRQSQPCRQRGLSVLLRLHAASVKNAVLSRPARAMRIATWNVNSLTARLPHVLDWLAANPVQPVVHFQNHVVGNVQPGFGRASRDRRA